MEVYGETNVGLARKVNQDSIFYSKEPVGTLQNLFIVADGMGGHAAGDFASRYTIDTIISVLEYSQNTHLISAIRDSITAANRMLVRKADENLDMYGMGTTLVLATIENGILYVANIGDSRLYMVNPTGIRQITRDHSFVEEMVKAGKMERDSEEYNRNKNVITRAVGTPQGVEADYFEIELLPNQMILMCSDGLTNMVSDKQLHRIMTSHRDIKMAVKTMIAEANAAGGLDNISALLIKPGI